MGAGPILPGRGRRLWDKRGADRRGVSPIIGIILLVAIAVVLAAVLYVMVSQLAHVSETTPLGTVLVLGPAEEVKGAASTNGFCAKGYPCYSVSIASVGSGVTLGSMSLVVKNGSGGTRIVQTNSAQLSVVGASGKAVAYTTIKKGAPLEATSWAKYAPGFSSHSYLSELMTIWVQFGTTNFDPVNQGFSLEAVGSGSFSGIVSCSLP
jgi:flagellin-like protein